MPENILIARGAEAILTRDGGRLTKDRISKGYRAPELDSRIRAGRTRLESRAIGKAAEAGVNVPKILSVDEKGAKIEMEFLDGAVLKNSFSLDAMPLVAEQVAHLHAAGVIHGDLTTSNMILVGSRLYLIDFGLAKFSVSAEDRAVDIHVFAEALESTHTELAGQAFDKFLEAYGARFPEVASRLKKVEARGRYK